MSDDDDSDGLDRIAGPLDQMTIWRCAQRVSEQVGRIAKHSPLPALDSIDSYFDEMVLKLNKLRQTRDRGWAKAGERITTQMKSLSRIIQQQLQKFTGKLDETKYVQSPADVFRDLTALQDDIFTEMAINLKDGVIDVTTEDIVLEDIDLGPFRIELHWKRFFAAGDPLPGQVFRCISLHRNCAGPREGTYHPHVDGSHLCMGEGGPTIRAALVQGRVLDFFVLVNQILNTYNPESAYCRLDQWHDEDANMSTCTDCGGRYPYEEEGASCASCGDGVCGDCYHVCPGCDDCYCASHVIKCVECAEYTCESCATVCSKCGGKKCYGCMDSGQEKVCQMCAEDYDEVLADDVKPLLGEPTATTPAPVPIPNVEPADATENTDSYRQAFAETPRDPVDLFESLCLDETPLP